jgi:hypothetical protein
VASLPLDQKGRIECRRGVPPLVLPLFQFVRAVAKRRDASSTLPAFLLRNKNQFLLPLPRTKCGWGAAFLICPPRTFGSGSQSGIVWKRRPRRFSRPLLRLVGAVGKRRGASSTLRRPAPLRALAIRSIREMNGSGDSLRIMKIRGPILIPIVAAFAICAAVLSPFEITSNCGGNSAALAAVGNYALMARFEATESPDRSFNYIAIAALKRALFI